MKSHNERAAEQGFTKFKVQVNQETHYFNTYEEADTFTRQFEGGSDSLGFSGYIEEKDCWKFFFIQYGKPVITTPTRINIDNLYDSEFDLGSGDFQVDARE